MTEAKTKAHHWYTRAVNAAPVWLLIISVTLFIGGRSQLQKNHADDARVAETQKAATKACYRSQAVGPALVRTLDSLKNVPKVVPIPPVILAGFYREIPPIGSCPGQAKPTAGGTR